MAKKASIAADGSPPVEPKNRKPPALSRTPLRASSLLDTRVIYCGDNLEQLANLPDACVDLIYSEPNKAMLLPKKPDLDLEKRLQHLHISIIWREGELFQDNASGQFS